MTKEQLMLKVLNRKFPFIIEVIDKLSDGYCDILLVVDYKKFKEYIKEYIKIDDKYLSSMDLIMGHYSKRNEYYSLMYLSSMLNDNINKENEPFQKLEYLRAEIVFLMERFYQSYLPESLKTHTHCYFSDFIFK